MSDRRDGHITHVTGMGPVDDDFGGDLDDRTVAYIGGHRAFHIQADVRSEFSAAESASRGYSILAEVESTFKARLEDDDIEIFESSSFIVEDLTNEPRLAEVNTPPPVTAWQKLKRWWNG